LDENNKLVTSISKFVSTYLPDTARSYRSGKVIHDSVWGTHLYNPKEIAFLDTPLFQRLRYIHQTGFAYTVYPTSAHSRFEHTLGVVSQISKFAEEVRNKQLKQGRENTLNPEDIEIIRLAALFHDLGHGLFSHCSETLYALMPDIQHFIEPGGEFEGIAGHELLSYLIVNSEPFRIYYKKVTGSEDGLQEIANLIIGKEEPAFKYKADFLYSILDSDKIDYIHRDAQFSGLPLTIDLERLKYAVDVVKIILDGVEWNKLSVLYTGVTPLEQILVSRFMLYPMLYHHHKIRACDCMFHGIIEYINNHDSRIVLARQKISFKEPVDFLWGNDVDFIGIGMSLEEDDPLHRLLHDLVFRRLLNRVAILNYRTVDDPTSFENLLKFRGTETFEQWQELRNTAHEICKRANKENIKVMPEQIWIDLPNNPKTGRDVEESKILYPNGDSVDLPDVFPIAEWVGLYDTNRWQGHIFAPFNCQESIAPIAKDVLREKYGFTLKDEAFNWCHVTPPK